MEGMKINLIIAIIGAIVTSTISGVSTYVSQDNKFGEQIENLSKESNSKGHQIEILTDENSTLKNEINSKTESHNALMAEHNDLKVKYARCISSEGSITAVGTIDTRVYQGQLKTGDELEFKLTSSSLFIKIIRVSDSGPIISIAGCENYVTVNEVRMPMNNENHYLIKPQSPLRVRFTVGSCEDNENIEPSQVEEIILLLRQFNVDEQTIQLEYNRKFLF
ncbi:MAG: hypothetical protein KAR19_12660 [Bacteroidales bacterium]|nr:hypothetical protein [Bacteroidales bacterium]